MSSPEVAPLEVAPDSVTIAASALKTLNLAGFHALAEPTRVQVLELLVPGELCVCDLNASLHMAQSRLSFHLKVLKEAELVLTRQQGRWIYYRLNPDRIQGLQTCLTQFQSAAASAISPSTNCCN